MSCFLGGCGQGWLGPLCRVVGALLGVGWFSGSGTQSSARAEVAVFWLGWTHGCHGEVWPQIFSSLDCPRSPLFVSAFRCCVSFECALLQMQQLES